MQKSVTILGAGSWGMAVSQILSDNDCQATLWEYNTKEARRLESERTREEKLVSFKLSDSVTVTSSLKEALNNTSLVILAVPSQNLRMVLNQAQDYLGEKPKFLNLAKGIENKTLKRMSEVVEDVLGDSKYSFATLSGPSHAEEVARRMPTTITVAGHDDRLNRNLQELFSNSYFRVYKSSDLVGVEMGGALKNIIAIAAGIIFGLGMGDNTTGALVTRGLAEISRLGISMGASAETFAGLSGVGDLITTCVSKHSRNRYVGVEIGKGRNLEDILEGMTMVAEGVETTRAGYELSRLKSVEMPITKEVYKVLFENKTPGEAIWELMGRELKSEIRS